VSIVVSLYADDTLLYQRVNSEADAADFQYITAPNSRRCLLMKVNAMLYHLVAKQAFHLISLEYTCPMD